MYRRHGHRDDDTPSREQQDKTKGGVSKKKGTLIKTNIKTTGGGREQEEERQRQIQALRRGSDNRMQRVQLTQLPGSCCTADSTSPGAAARCGATFAVVYIQERMCCMYGCSADRKRKRTSGAAHGSLSCSCAYKQDSRAGPLGKPSTAHLQPGDSAPDGVSVL